MFNEEKYIKDLFKNNFACFKEKSIVIYGLGKNTKLILDTFTDYNIVGLMDQARTGEYVWGKCILSNDEVLAAKAQVIIIVSTAANVPIIYRRIKTFCKEHQIDVYDIGGNLLNQEKKKYLLPAEYARLSESGIKEAIQAADVISFDIFDTLLVRTVLLPTDIFENIYEKNKDLLAEYGDFVRRRIDAERRLYLNTNPTIAEIYEEMVNSGFPTELATIMLHQEIVEEKKSLKARNGMPLIVNYAMELDKLVCCTSDMYLPSDILREILSASGYPETIKIYVSCEWKKSKSDGLFEIVRNDFDNKKILHIGDNTTSDIEIPLKYGIDETFQVMSVYQMAEDSRQAELLDYTNTLRNRNFIGRYYSRVFNSPFGMKESEGRGGICSEYDLGFYYIEPILETFLFWMIETCENRNIRHVYLTSRDGWLIERMLDIISLEKEIGFTYEYIYVSRAACTLAGIETIEDVKYASTMAFDGNAIEMLEKRFLMKPEEMLNKVEDESEEAYILRHANVILKKARKYREGYRLYLEHVHSLTENIGLFDFVSSGTCQLWLEKIMNRSYVGLYFIRNLDEYKAHLDIESMYKPKTVYEKQSKMFENYVLMENVLTSPEPTLQKVDFDGKLVFLEDTRSQKEIEAIHHIHAGIIDAMRESLKNSRELPEQEVAECILNFVKKSYSRYDFDFIQEGALRDEFCNREFSLKSLVEEPEND